MNYTVTAGTGNYFDDTIEVEAKSQKAAVKAAKELCAEYTVPVYVSFFRASDGQVGYLNPDGNHDITGKNWNASK